MGNRRTPKPVLVLLLLFAALFSPTTPAASASPSAGLAITRAVTPQEAVAQRGRTGAEHRSDRPEIRATVAAASAVPLPSTPARDARLAAPRLLLVQRPRPPTSTYADSDVSAPTGRSPPSPAGT
ncbi:MAG: hypothetical protein QOE99_3271 [Actinomycetota bacterium]|jgi:hypothetical protein|nr:hypothetical protein [Actinomycetota bacterium]